MQRSLFLIPHVERGRETSSLHIKGDVTITRHYLHDVRASFALSRQETLAWVSCPTPFKDIRLADDGLTRPTSRGNFSWTHRSRVSAISKVPPSRSILSKQIESGSEVREEVLRVFHDFDQFGNFPPIFLFHSRIIRRKIYVNQM